MAIPSALRCAALGGSLLVVVACVWWTRGHKAAPDAAAALPSTERAVHASTPDLRPADHVEARNDAGGATPVVPASKSLLLELHGLSAEVHGPIAIAVCRPSSYMQKTALLALTREVAAEIELDLGPLAATVCPAEDLVLILDHPLYMRTYAWVRAKRELQPDGGRRIPVHLVPIASALVGTTRIDPGIATGPVSVMLYPLRDGVPDHQPCDWTRVAPGERFRLRSTATGRHAVVALTRSGTHDEPLRPASAIVDLALGAELELQPLELGWGESLAGSVVRKDGTQPAAVRVTAILLRRAQETYVDDTKLAWADGCFELLNVEQEFTGNGFRVRGLAPGHYALRAVDVRSESLEIPCLGCGDGRGTAEATASAVGLVVSTDMAMPVRFRVTGSGRPLRALVSLTQGSSSASTSAKASPEGLYDVVVDPALPCSVSFIHIVHESRQLDFEPYALVPGSIVDVELEAGPVAAASFVLELSHDTAEPLADRPIDVEIHSMDDVRANPSQVASRVRLGPDAPAKLRFMGGHLLSPDLVRAGPRLTVESLPPGSYFVRVIPRAAQGNGLPDSMWLETRLEIELAPGEHVKRIVQPELGGAVRFEVRGQPSPANMPLELEGPVASKAPGLFDLPAATAANPLRYACISQLVQPLRAGPWIARAGSSGATPRTVSFTVEAGTTTEVVIDLTGL